MAVLEDIVLVADGGDLTVGRRAATYVYGSFEVILPDGMEPTESDGRLQDGYIYRPDDSGTGRFDVGFVRADATVDMEAQISDVESVLDAAQKRVEGDVFFERDITTAGLGEYRPGVDFETGDIVSVELWGKRFPSPITAIDYVSSDSEGIGGVRVHAGGQLIADPVALRKQNSALQKQIASEKARRMREVANIRTGLTGSWNGDILDAVKGGVNHGALGMLNQADVDLDEKFTPVQSLVNSQIGVNGAIRNNVNSMSNLVNGNSKPPVNSNLWNINVRTWEFQGSFNEAQTAINKWVAESIDILDKRIPVVLSLNKTSQAGVGRIYKDGDRYYFQKYFSANCRILWVVALEAIDSYAWTSSTEMTGGVNQTAFVNPGLLQNITSLTVTVYRQDRMPEISLPTVSRGTAPDVRWPIRP